MKKIRKKRRRTTFTMRILTDSPGVVLSIPSSSPHHHGIVVITSGSIDSTYASIEIVDCSIRLLELQNHNEQSNLD